MVTTPSHTSDIMECPVCYCAIANCKLICGHGLCGDCAKSWYKKSDEPNCPMCRQPMYFKGLREVKKEMEKDRFDEHCTDLFSEALDDIFEEWEMECLELRKAEIHPGLFKFFLNDVMEDLKSAEKKIKVMREQEWGIDEMRCVLEGWEFQYHDRWSWINDPRSEIIPQIRTCKT